MMNNYSVATNYFSLGSSLFQSLTPSCFFTIKSMLHIPYAFEASFLQNTREYSAFQ